MRPSSLILSVCLVGLLTIATVTAAEDLDPNWLVGKWEGQGQSSDSNVGTFQFQAQLKPDGTFEGESRSRGFGAVTLHDGKWKITGDTVMFNYRTDVTIPMGRFLSNYTWTLKRAGENLEGSGLNTTMNTHSSMTLKRAR